MNPREPNKHYPNDNRRTYPGDDTVRNQWAVWAFNRNEETQWRKWNENPDNHRRDEINYLSKYSGDHVLPALIGGIIGGFILLAIPFVSFYCYTYIKKEVAANSDAQSDARSKAQEEGGSQHPNPGLGYVSLQPAYTPTTPMDPPTPGCAEYTYHHPKESKPEPGRGVHSSDDDVFRTPSELPDNRQMSSRRVDAPRTLPIRDNRAGYDYGDNRHPDVYYAGPRCSTKTREHSKYPEPETGRNEYMDSMRDKANYQYENEYKGQEHRDYRRNERGSGAKTPTTPTEREKNTNEPVAGFSQRKETNFGTRRTPRTPTESKSADSAPYDREPTEFHRGSSGRRLVYDRKTPDSATAPSRFHQPAATVESGPVTRKSLPAARIAPTATEESDISTPETTRTNRVQPNRFKSGADYNPNKSETVV